MSQGKYEEGGKSSTVIISRCDDGGGCLLCGRSYGGSKVCLFNVFAAGLLLFDSVCVDV